jgi:hypothetical protein
MIPRFTLLLAVAVTAAASADEAPDDLLRFTDGDQLHGKFAGLDDRGRVLWKRQDVENTVEFETDKLRQIVLRGGRPAKGIDSGAHARLLGGDRIPGTIVSLDAETLVLDTPLAGQLALPRNHLEVLAPQPFGGRVHYAGPFNSEGWQILDPPPGDNDEEEQEPDADGDEESREPWQIARTAWYSGDSATGRPLVRESGMEDAAVLRFRLAWRNQLALSVGFHADFIEPKAEDEDDENADAARARRGTLALPYRFGSSYVLSLHSHYAMMYRCGFDEDGKPFTRRMQNSSNSFRLPQVGNSAVELRCDRKSGRILLFVDGEFAMQWDESEEGYAGIGKGFGFLVNSSGSQVRISDILVAEWNGMIDSARSMDAPDRDVVLLTNGTDRFSGKVSAVRDDHLELASSYADMKIPLSRVAEIHFARESLAELPEAKADELVVHAYPVGRISGTPLRSGSDQIILQSPHVGEIAVQLDYAALLDLQPGHSFVDEWDIQF